MVPAFNRRATDPPGISASLHPQQPTPDGLSPDQAFNSTISNFGASTCCRKNARR